jgi:hypothetical protein
MLQLTKAYKMQQFEQSVMKEIQAAVLLATKSYGNQVGIAGRFPADTFFKALRVMEDLTKALDKLTQIATRRADPTTAPQRLHWFIEAVLDLLVADVKERWLGQDDPDQSEAHYYTSWTQFRASLFTTICHIIDFTPAGLMDQLPYLVAPAKCASRHDLWVALEQVQGAARTLAEMKSVSATQEIEAATVKYLDAWLLPEAKKSMIEMLANKFRGGC